MRSLKNYLINQIKLTIDYLKNTPIFLVISSVTSITSIISAAISTLFSILLDNPYILIYVLLFIVIIQFITNFYISTHSVNINQLYLDKETFLLDVLTNIMEVNRIKNTEDINHVKVENLTVTCTIDNPTKISPLESNLNIEWKASCIVLDQKIYDYHMIYSKSDSKRKANPKVTITSNDSEKYEAIITEMNTGIYNRFWAKLEPGVLPVDTEFDVTIKLENYFRFIWSDYETLMVNTNLYGTCIEEVNIILIFENDMIANTNITIYEIDQITLKRKKIQHLSHKIENSKHVYSFHKKSKIEKCTFLIVIPKSI